MTRTRREQKRQTSENNDWLRRIEAMSKAVDVWQSRATNPPPVEPGSSLAADSVEGLNVENPVWYSMCISTEHLKFAIDAMRATSTMYPTAYLTVARTAYVAAVNAVWVLAPPMRQDRRERALRVRADGLRLQMSALRSMQLPDGKPDEARNGVIAQLRQRQSELQSVAERLGMKENVTKMKFNQTSAIDWVVRHMHGADEGFLVGANQSVWRSGSAAAHGQYDFGVMRQGSNEVVRTDDGGSVVRLRGDLDNDVGPALGASFVALTEAFRLYDLQRVPPARA